MADERDPDERAGQESVTVRRARGRLGHLGEGSKAGRDFGREVAAADIRRSASPFQHHGPLRHTLHFQTAQIGSMKEGAIRKQAMLMGLQLCTKKSQSIERKERPKRRALFRKERALGQARR